MNKLHKNPGKARTSIAITLCAVSLILSLFLIRSQKGESTVWVARVTIPAGIEIREEMLFRSKVALGSLAKLYLQGRESIVGKKVHSIVHAGEILASSNIAHMDDIASRRIISLHLLGSDIPYGSSIGSKVSLYKVVDSQPGQPVDPILEVTRDAFITFINSKDNTFTGNVSASFSVSESDATRILQASSSGRLVVVLQND